MNSFITLIYLGIILNSILLSYKIFHYKKTYIVNSNIDISLSVDNINNQLNNDIESTIINRTIQTKNAPISNINNNINTLLVPNTAKGFGIKKQVTIEENNDKNSNIKSRSEKKEEYRKLLKLAKGSSSLHKMIGILIYIIIYRFIIG